MKALLPYKTNDILFLDVETVRAVDKLDPLSDLGKAWEYKSRYQNELKEKMERDGSEAAENFLQQFFEEKGALYAPFGKIVTIVVGRLLEDGDLKVTAFSGDEKTLLEKFSNSLSQFTVSRPEAAFCTFNGNNFDIPYIVKRMLVHGVHLHDMLDPSDVKPWLLKRIDLSKLWQQGSYYPDSLAAVAAALGIKSPKGALAGKDVGTYFYAGRLPEIVDYCIEDVVATAQIYLRFAQKNPIRNVVKT